MRAQLVNVAVREAYRPATVWMQAVSPIALNSPSAMPDGRARCKASALLNFFAATAVILARAEGHKVVSGAPNHALSGHPESPTLYRLLCTWLCETAQTMGAATCVCPRTGQETRKACEGRALQNRVCWGIKADLDYHVGGCQN